jgi:cation transport regulator ChaC
LSLIISELITRATSHGQLQKKRDYLLKELQVLDKMFQDELGDYTWKGILKILAEVRIESKSG